jgi:excisionase family DNA binding protein
VLDGKLAYSITEASKATDVGRTKLYQEIKEARLRTVKVGRRTLILVEDLRLWLDSLRATESRG